MNESHSLLSNSLQKYQVEANHSDQDLFEHLSMELKEITALYNAGVALNSSLDPKQVILALYKEASRLIDTSNFALVIYDEVKHNLNFLLVFCNLKSQTITTRFEQSKGTQTPTYHEIIQWWQQLDARSGKVKMLTMGMTDAGYPLHLVVVANNGDHNFANIRKNKEFRIFP